MPDGLAIRRARERLGWSLGDLADRAEIGEWELSLIEREALTLAVIPGVTFVNIARALGVPAASLISARTKAKSRLRRRRHPP